MAEAAENGIIDDGIGGEEIQQEGISQDEIASSEQTKEVEQHQESPAEIDARSKGWRPKEEFEGDDWVDAGEFLRRGELFDTIKGLKKRVKKSEDALNTMASQFTKTVEAQVKRQMSELKSQRREAIEIGDADKVDQLDQQMEELKTETVEKKEENNGVPEEIQEFIDKNKSWFNVDKTMTNFAIAHNQSVLADNPGIDLEESLDITMKEIKKLFPDKFENQKRTSPAPVATQGKPPETGSGKSKYTMDRLDAEQKMAYDAYVRKGKILSHDDYFKGLEEIGALA